MTDWNNPIAHIADPPHTVRLEMGTRSFGVLSAPGAFLIHCLRGQIWITQEANRDDVVLVRGAQCRAAGSQKVFVNAWNGALLALSIERPGAAETGRPRARPLDLRVEITQGAYVLSGGRSAYPRAVGSVSR